VAVAIAAAAAAAVVAVVAGKRSTHDSHTAVRTKKPAAMRAFSFSG
jgi:hypothetical protein